MRSHTVYSPRRHERGRSESRCRDCLIETLDYSSGTIARPVSKFNNEMRRVQKESDWPRFLCASHCASRVQRSRVKRQLLMNREVFSTTTRSGTLKLHRTSHLPQDQCTFDWFETQIMTAQGGRRWSPNEAPHNPPEH